MVSKETSLQRPPEGEGAGSPASLLQQQQQGCLSFSIRYAGWQKDAS